MRKVLTIVIALLSTVSAGAGDRKFSLNLDAFDWSPRRDERTRARLAEWNDPMGRMLYHFNQQQAWIMRGTMPGGERVTGVAVRVKHQNALPLNLIASTIRAGSDVAQRDLVRFGKRRTGDEQLDLLSLEEQLSEELGRRLRPQ